MTMGSGHRFGRRMDYLRLSVTDRCNLRRVHCMGEGMKSHPRGELLTLEEFCMACVRRLRRPAVNR